MKLTLLLIVFLYSCNRGNDILNNQPEISFDINGTHYSHTGEQTAANGGIGVFAVKSAGIPGATNTFYSFSGYQNVGNIIQVVVQTPNDTLKTVSYNQGITFSLKVGGDQYIVAQPIVSFSSYQNGIVNGSFAGSASKVVSVNPTVLTPVTFSNGIIKNVRINY